MNKPSDKPDRPDAPLSDEALTRLDFDVLEGGEGIALVGAQAEVRLGSSIEQVSLDTPYIRGRHNQQNAMAAIAGAALAGLSPRRSARPEIVVLTPGIYNSAYVEHAYLAQEMGCELVEGRDLYVDDEDCVYLHTVYGPQRVDVIYRRIDDDFLDLAVHQHHTAVAFNDVLDGRRHQPLRRRADADGAVRPGRHRDRRDRSSRGFR